MEYSKDNKNTIISISVDNLFVQSHPELFKDNDFTKKINEAKESSVFDFLDHPDKVYNPNNIIVDK
jgi:hypothetical protein